jgi:hypothetical protein
MSDRDIAGIVLALIITFTILVSRYVTNKLEEEEGTCPHGEGWDDCPDCRH